LAWRVDSLAPPSWSIDSSAMALFFAKQRVLEGSALAWLFLLVFLALFLASHGDNLVRRLVKIGSSGFELLPEERSLDALRTPPPPRQDLMDPEKRAITAEEKDHYQQLSDFILVVAATTNQQQLQEDERLCQDYELALLYSGRYAFLSGKAKRKNRRLRRTAQEPRRGVSLGG
jgi:hypothetical protein